MANLVTETASYKNLSATGAVKVGGGQLLGVFVASSSSGTLKFWDALTATAPIIVNTFNASAGIWYPLPFSFSTGLFVTVGGTIDCTVAFV